MFGGIGDQMCVKKWYINKAYNHQVEQVRLGQPLDKKYDDKVFRLLREKMGLDNVRMIVTGAAPMPPYLARCSCRP